MSEQNIMLDLETLSSEPNAAIISIGACYFGSGGVGGIFYRQVDPETDKDGHISSATVKWWMSQPPAARQAFEAQGSTSLMEALGDFTAFVKHSENPSIWGNGSDFDNVVIRSAYARAGLKAPWKFSSHRCYRTLKNMRPDIPFERNGVAHNALDDAVSQAKHAIALMRALGLWA